MKKRKITFDVLAAIALPLLFVLMLAKPDAVREAAAAALRDAGCVIVPVLFPFAVLSSFLLGSEMFSRTSSTLMRPICRHLHLPDEAGCAVLIGFFAGFPLGIGAVCRLYRDGKIGRDDAERLLALCHNTGPAFVIGYVGAAVFRSVPFGIFLYLTEITTALLIASCMAKNKPYIPSPKTIISKEKPTGFGSALRDSAVAMLMVTSAVVWCRTLVGVLVSVIPGFSGSVAEAVVSAVVECTSGITAASDLPGAATFALAGFSLGFSGISVLLQGASFASEAGLSMKKCTTAKVFQGLFCAAAAALYSRRSTAACMSPVTVVTADYRLLTILEIALLTLFLILPGIIEKFKKRRKHGAGNDIRITAEKSKITS